MEIREVSDQVYVSTQITVEDLSELSKLGLKSVICNRPDGEEVAQPTFAQISDAARDLGIEARFIPVVGGKMGADDLEAFKQALGEMPMPILAYCRSGTRSAMLWSLVNANAGDAPGGRMN